MRSKTLFAQKTLVSEEYGSFSLEYYILALQSRSEEQETQNTATEDTNEIYGIEIVQTAHPDLGLVRETLWGITDSRDVIMSLAGRLSDFEVMPVHAAAVIDDLNSALS